MADRRAADRPRRQAERRGLLGDVGRSVRAALLLRPRRAALAGRPAAVAARRVHGRGAVHAALRALLPAAASAHRRRAGRAADVPLPARGPVRLRGAVPARAAEPHARPAGLPRRADRDRRARRGSRSRLLARARGPAEQARDGDLEAAHGQVRVLVDRPRRPARAHGRPLRAAAARGQLVRRRPRPRERRDPDVQGARGSGATSSSRPAASATSGCRRSSTPPKHRPPPPWQMGETVGEARIELSGDTAWWVERTYRPPYGHMEDDVFVTPYADLSHLAAWILRLDGRAVPLEPDALRREVAAGLRRVASGSHLPRPRRRPSRVRSRPRRCLERPTGPVNPERFGVLQALLAYLLAACGDESSAVIPTRDLVERFPQIPEEAVEEHLALLNLVNFGGGCYAVYAELRGDRDPRRQGALRRHVPLAAATDAARGARDPARARVRRADDRRRGAPAARPRPQEARGDVRRVRAPADGADEAGQGRGAR